LKTIAFDRLPTKLRPTIGTLLVSVGAALATAIFFRLAFSFDQLAFLIWLAFVPLFLASVRYSPGYAFIYGWLGSFPLNYGTFYWIFGVSGAELGHGLLLGAYLGIFPAIVCSVVAFSRPIPVLFVLLTPSAWVISDYLRAHMGSLAFSWSTPAYWQHANPTLLQLASFAGEYGVTFLIVFVNAALALAIMERRWLTLSLTATVIPALWIPGTPLLDATGDKVGTIRVAVVQPAFTPEEMRSFDATRKLDRLRRLTLSAAQDKPDVIVWPEAAVHDWKTDLGLLSDIGSIARGADAPIVFGMSESGKDIRSPAGQDAETQRPSEMRRNSTLMIDRTGSFAGIYHKHRLVPFSELSPLEDWLEWPDWIPTPDEPTTPGDEHVTFALPNAVSGFPIICWENLFGDFVSRSISEGPGLVLHIVNDNWGGRTLASRQHNAASALRAAENRIPVVTASNTGPSQIFDARGRVVAEVPDLFVEGVVVVDVDLVDDRSLYYRLGDWVVLLSGVLLAMGSIRLAARADLQSAIHSRRA
jgi:apolipoprotein N-acyltransferase